MTAPARFGFNSSEILNQYTTVATRNPGELVAPGNYGTFNSVNELLIPDTNVGTTLMLTARLKDYLYVDIAIQGSVAGVTAYAPNAAVGCVGGIAMVIGNNFICRIPYCGEIEKFLFYLSNYVVKKITVVYKTVYNQEKTDLTKFTLFDLTGWVYTATTGKYSKTIATGITSKVSFGGVLPLTYVARMGVEITPSVGLPTTDIGYTYFDGINTFSNELFSSVICFLPTVNSLAYLEFTNKSVDPITIYLSPTVMNFLNISTTFGADVQT